MKNKILLSTLFALAFSLTATSQSTELLSDANGFNYQAVLRDAGGDILANHAATMRFTFYNYNVNAAVQYQEVQDLETTPEGLVNTVVGTGAGNGFNLVGNWENIYWGEAPVFMKTEVDLLDGNGYISLGIQQIWSVPQALVSGKATNMVMSDLLDVHFYDAPMDGQILQYSTELENWGPVDVPALSVFLEEISISGGNSVNMNAWNRDGNSGIAANAFLGTEDGHDLVFKTNAAERMRLGQDGGVHILESTHIDQNVGIGIAPSTYKLHLHSDVNPQPAIQFTNAVTGSAFLDGSRIGMTTAGDFQIINNENTDMTFTNNIFERMRIKSNGNIGIGTSNPQSMLNLHTDSGIDTYMRFSSAPSGLTVNDGALLGLASNLDFNIKLQENAKMNFFTNNVSRMTITGSGLVGIGTSTPTALLDVNGVLESATLNVAGLAEVGDLVTDLVNAQYVHIESMDASGLDPNCNFGKRLVVADCYGTLEVANQWEDGSNEEMGYYFNVPGSAFQPSYPSVDYNITFTGEMRLLEGDYATVIAPVFLPHNAYILEVKAYVYDSFVDGNLTVSLVELRSDGGYSTSEETTSGSGGHQVLTFNPSSFNVDNTSQGLSLTAHMVEDETPGLDIIGIKSVSIRYRLD